MKFLLGLILSMMIVSSIALPVNDPNDDAEIVDVVNSETNADQDYPSFLVPIPPYSFFETIEEYFRSLRQKLLTRFIDIGDDLDLDPSKGNSTSTIEVINGHKIEINNTVYADKSENGDEIFKVRVVQIRPLDVEGTNDTITKTEDLGDVDEQTSQPNAEGTTANHDLENEIDPTKLSTTKEDERQTFLLPVEEEDSDQVIANLYKLPNESSQALYYKTKEDHQNENSDYDIDFYQFNDYQNSTSPLSIARDESESIKENTKLNTAEQSNMEQDIEESAIKNGMPNFNNFINTQTSLTTVEGEQNHRSREHSTSSEEVKADGTYDAYENFEFNNDEWQTFSNADVEHNEENEIDGYESIPIDLSNDINVNYIVQQNGGTPDPDVEVFSLDDLNSFKTEHSHYKHSSDVYAYDDSDDENIGYFLNSRRNPIK